MQGFQFPPSGFGPGSQPDEGEKLEWMPMPSGMATYEPRIPEIEDAAAAAPALALLERAAEACARVAATGTGETLPLEGLDGPARALIVQTLGEGEVSAKIEGAQPLRAQESVFAGLWVIFEEGADRLEIGAVPAALTARGFAPVKPAAGPFAPTNPAVVNAPGMVTEIFDAASRRKPGTAPHVINLTLLPHTEADLVWLDEALGEGSVTMLSRGYGNCRVTATALDHVWRVQFFNSMDTLILDTFEITTLPAVVEAASEDLQDSGERLVEVLEAIR